MRYYEIIIIINCNQEQVFKLIKKIKNIILINNGKIYKIENWGHKKLIYKIKNIKKAYYICLNIEINLYILNKIKDKIKFDLKILRNLIIRTKTINLDPSIMIKKLI